jgi:hypothetical protein
VPAVTQNTNCNMYMIETTCMYMYHVCVDCPSDSTIGIKISDKNFLHYQYHVYYNLTDPQTLTLPKIVYQKFQG